MKLFQILKKKTLADDHNHDISIFENDEFMVVDYNDMFIHAFFNCYACWC